MRLGSRRVRLKAVWLLLVPFLILARPTAGLLVVGGSVAALGAAIRAWAAGCIRKDRELATTGPYAHTRNPLYLGSLLIGAGVTLAGGRWLFVALFLLFYATVYRRAILNEEKGLEEEFGDVYHRYREGVPALLPRLTPYVDPGPGVQDAEDDLQGGTGAGAGVGDASVKGRESRAAAASSGARSWSAAARVGAPEVPEATEAPGDPTTAEDGSGGGATGAGVGLWAFSVRRYLLNREWEAALGLVAGFGYLAFKMLWS